MAGIKLKRHFFYVAFFSLCFFLMGLYYIREVDFSYLGYRELKFQTRRIARSLDNYVLQSKILGTTRGLGLKNKLISQSLEEDGFSNNIEVLDLLYKIKKLYTASLVFLLDSKGTAVASTSYEGGKNIVGNNYAFRPYFKKAKAHAMDVVYPALGVTTKKRGFYYSSPIFNYEGQPYNHVVGVIVVKMGLEKLELFLDEAPLDLALVSPGGLVFGSNRREWLYKKIFPEQVGFSNSDFHQFEFKEEAVNSIFSATRNGRYTSLNHQEYSYSYYPVSLEDDSGRWYLYCFQPVSEWYPLNLVMRDQLIGILLFALIFFHVYVTMRRKDRETELDLLLEDTQKKSDTFFDVPNDGIFLQSLDTKKFLKANKKFFEIFDYPINYLYQLSFEMISEGNSPYSKKESEQWIQKAIQDGVQQFEWKGKRKDGKTVWLEVRLEALSFLEGGIVLGVVKNIEDIKKEQLDLKKLQEQLIKADKMNSLGLLATSIPQEVTAPLSESVTLLKKIHGFVSLLMTIVSLYEEAKDYCGKEQLELMGQTIERLEKVKEEEDFSRWSKELLPLTNESIDKLQKVQSVIDTFDLYAHSEEGEEVRELSQLNDLIRASVMTVFDQEKFEDSVHLDLKEIPLIHCHSAQVTQVFINLLLNSKKAIENDGTILINTRIDGEFVCCEISDNGCGIPLTYLDKIFDPFFSGDKEKGNIGLGLTVAYSIIRGHGGMIEVESDEGHGTSFRVFLPIKG